MHSATHCTGSQVASTAVCLLNLTSLKRNPTLDTARVQAYRYAACGRANTNTPLTVHHRQAAGIIRVGGCRIRLAASGSSDWDPLGAVRTPA